MNLDEFLPYLVAGIVTGSVFGMSGAGLVVGYRTTGTFNFAYGAVGSLAAFFYWDLTVQRGLHSSLAILVCLFVFAPVAGILTHFVNRGVAGASPAMKIVGIVGLMLAVQGLITVLYGSDFRTVKTFMPFTTFRVSGVYIGYDQVITAVIGIVVVGGLYAFLQLTRTGAYMRAVVDNPDLVAVTGRDPERFRLGASVVGTMFATIAGLLLAPAVGLDGVALTLLVVQAFGAAAIGRFKSLPLTYLGGLAVGVAAALSTKYVTDIPELIGFPASVPFVALFLVLLITPRRLLIELTTSVLAAPQAAIRRRARTTKGALAAIRSAPAHFASLPVLARYAIGASLPPLVMVVAGTQLIPIFLIETVIVVGLLKRFAPPQVGYTVIGGALLLVPPIAGTKISLYISGLILVLVFLSLDLLVRTSGQVSLCQIAFVAVGAATFSNLTTDAGFPWVIGLICAGLVAVPIGILLALPAIRLSGLFLALATFGFGVAVETILYTRDFLFGNDFSYAPRPHISGLDLEGDTGFYYVCLAVVVVGLGFVALIRRGRLGRLLRAMADSPTALNHLGLNINLTKVVAFGVSAFLAGVAGGLMGAMLSSYNGESFPYITSLYWLAVIGVVTRFGPYAALLAGISGVIPAYLDSGFGGNWFEKYRLFLFGLAATLAALRSARPARFVARRYPIRATRHRRPSSKR